MNIQFKRFDVRDLIRRGGGPFPEIRKRVDALKAGEICWVWHRSCRRRLWRFCPLTDILPKLSATRVRNGWFIFGAKVRFYWN